jgi:hypothetical protein
VAATALAASATWCPIVDAAGRRRSADATPATIMRRTPVTVTTNAGARGGAARTVPVPGSSRKAPASPPLTAGQAYSPGAEALPDAGSQSPEADPLVANGLGSPLCRGALGASQLSGAGRRNCETSGFVAAADPTGDYGIDVHIDTGVLGLSTGGLLSTVQDLFITPVWMALVWAVHALVVMLEWCFAVDLLDSASVSLGLARGLRQAQATFTEPWLATVLAIGSVLAAYNGLIRRRVAETVGQALLMLAMMAAGIWVMLDPVGTVGAVGGWANQASLSTLAVSAGGTPARAGQALADSMGEVFATAVEVPWCYLEFGDVGWCRNPARLDPRLRAAAVSIAAGELTLAQCRQSSSALGLCTVPGRPQVEALEHSAQLLRAARSNGAIFLALPANGPQRNAIGDRASLLWAICQSDNATTCRGPSAAQAEFRTNRGTWARVGGLLLIVGGVLGLLLLLGFLALRLLASALFSLLYLMLAPAAVLAPALGDGGRAVFRRWAAQLLGALVSKLIFSFALGAILAVLSILSSLEALGWWTQWLLISAFWWGAFTHRHRVLQMAGGTLGGTEPTQRTLVRRAADAFEGPRRMIGGVRAARQRREQRREQRGANRVSADEHGRMPSPGSKVTRQTGIGRRAAPGPTIARPGAQASRTLQAEYREALARVGAAADIEGRMAAMRSQLARVKEEQVQAAGAGDARRMLRLADRGARIERDVDHEQAGLTAARRLLGEGAPGQGSAFSAEQADERERFLDAQAALLPSIAAGRRRAGERRDYPALAGLAGIRAAGVRRPRRRGEAIGAPANRSRAGFTQRSVGGPAKRGRRRRRTGWRWARPGNGPRSRCDRLDPAARGAQPRAGLNRNAGTGTGAAWWRPWRSRLGNGVGVERDARCTRGRREAQTAAGEG